MCSKSSSFLPKIFRVWGKEMEDYFMSIIANQIGLHGKKTNAVLISTPFMFKLLSPSFSPTHADIDLAILLHKICNTNGFIRYTCIHQIHEQMKKYFVSPRSLTQIYISMNKFIEHGLITVFSHDDGKQTFKLSYFQDENGKLYRYVALDPIVFTELFNKELQLASRKLFLLASVQQGDKSVLKRNLFGKEGIYQILAKNQPNHIQTVIDELKGNNSKKVQFLSVGSLKKKRGRYEYLYVSIHPDFKHEIVKGEEYREPLTPVITYHRKVAFIKKVLDELKIGELFAEIHVLIQLMKHLGYRVIRQVLREIREFVDVYGHFPKDLAYFITKEIRFARTKEILDLDKKYDIYDHIAPGLIAEEHKRRLYEFASAFSFYNMKTIRRMFKMSRKLVNTVYNNRVQLNLGHYVHDNELHNYKAIWGVRKYALMCQVTPSVYESIEAEAARIFRQRIQPLDKVIAWIHEQITKWAEENPVPAELQYGTYGQVETLILHYYQSQFNVISERSPHFKQPERVVSGG